ncbi:GOX/HAO [Ectocarpus sp. CCAP 1310/34]|nr:GOX/HAO [Ectocarpus sp. CCAP 1310/34]
MNDPMTAPVGPAQDTSKAPEAAGWEPVNVREFERHAQLMLSKNAFDYYASGANDMVTLRENRAAFNRLRLRPRILRDVSKVDTSTTVLGQKISSPICIAPTAMQRMAHDSGECATAGAAAKAGALMTLSSWSTTALEDVAKAGGPAGARWFQLYVYKDRKITEQLVKRALAAGYTALAVTVDTPVLGRREADMRNRFKLPEHLTMGNFVSAGGAHASGTKDGGNDSGLAAYVASLIDRTLDWNDIKWLRTICGSMKIVVKGVMTAEDAAESVRQGVDGIWVSNHGARQLDTTPATIEVLPEVVAAVSGRCEIYLDGGICRGTDVFKALALGAKAVFIGRPVLWGLAHSGEEGVSKVLKLLHDELVMALQLTGCTRVSSASRSMVTHQTSYFSKL